MARQNDFPCGICYKNVSNNHKAVFCNKCNLFVHIKCNDISVQEYRELENAPDEIHWFCKRCIKEMFPFGSLENDELSVLYNFDLPSFVEILPPFETTLDLVNLPSLSDYDIDEHMPQILILVISLYLTCLPYIHFPVIFLFFILI